MRQFFRIIEGPGRPDGRADQRPAGRGAHRDRHAVGRPGADGRDRAGGPGAEHVHQRRRPSRRAHRPAAGVAAGDGRPAAHRAGSEQPLVQRGETLSRVVSHPGRRHGRWRPCCDLGIRRGSRSRRAAGAVAAPVPQARRTCRGRPSARGRRLRPGVWPSERGWSKPTGAASGPTAPGWARGRGSPSPSLWSTTAAPARRRDSPRAARRGKDGSSKHPSSWSTTTRRCCTTCATRSSRQAMRRS